MASDRQHDRRSEASGRHVQQGARLDVQLDALISEAHLQLEGTFYEQVSPAMAALERAVVGLPIERAVADVVAEAARLTLATWQLLVRAGELRALERLRPRLVQGGPDGTR